MFGRFLQHTQDLPSTTPTRIKVDGPNGYSWEGELETLRTAISNNPVQTLGSTVKWDHLVVNADEHNFNSLGQIGYELVAVDQGKAYFKRPLTNANKTVTAK
jgi:hypothetical protein